VVLVSVDRSRVRPGKLREVEESFAELAAFVEASEPTVLAYSVHLHPDGAHVTVVQVHPDSVSMERHMELAGPRFARFRGLLDIVAVDLYGTPSAALVARLQEKARLLGGGRVEVHAPLAGFVRTA
jgi:quinol monooxygenase YgiN